MQERRRNKTATYTGVFCSTVANKQDGAHAGMGPSIVHLSLGIICIHKAHITGLHALAYIHIMHGHPAVSPLREMEERDGSAYP